MYHLVPDAFLTTLHPWGRLGNSSDVSRWSELLTACAAELFVPGSPSGPGFVPERILALQRGLGQLTSLIVLYFKKIPVHQGINVLHNLLMPAFHSDYSKGSTLIQMLERCWVKTTICLCKRDLDTCEVFNEYKLKGFLN